VIRFQMSFLTDQIINSLIDSGQRRTIKQLTAYRLKVIEPSRTDEDVDALGVH
jgi:hypothetical protein